MKVLIKEAHIIAPGSVYHDQILDLKIKNGVIEKLGNDLAMDDCSEVKIPNLKVSIGWFDSSVSFGEPGFEDRETIENGLQVAAQSGFTGVALQPNALPVIDNQSHIFFVKQKAAQSATSLYPIGALTKNSEGTDLAELYDMKNAGAIAFGDYNASTSNANLFKIGLQYVQDFDGLILSFCQDEKIKGSGVANEGVVSTRLGLKGIPSLAEELIVARNLFLLEYTGGKLHIPTISSTKTVALIKEAKQKGLQVTCSVSVHHLTLTDEVLTTFDSRYKVSPPLRSESDRLALIEGVMDGTIDCITSDHNPIDIEHKKMEFDLAKNGTIGLESAFGALMTVLPIEVIVQKLTAARSIFDLQQPEIKEGAQANLTLFTTDEKWTFSKESILSKSKNSAFLGFEMNGNVVGIFNNDKLVING